jgi:hypothetical protein
MFNQRIILRLLALLMLTGSASAAFAGIDKTAIQIAAISQGEATSACRRELQIGQHGATRAGTTAILDACVARKMKG